MIDKKFHEFIEKQIKQRDGEISTLTKELANASAKEVMDSSIPLLRFFSCLKKNLPKEISYRLFEGTMYSMILFFCDDFDEAYNLLSKLKKTIERKEKEYNTQQ